MKNWWWILLLIAGVAGAAMILQKTRIIVDPPAPFVGCKPTPEIIMTFADVQIGTTATETAEIFNSGDRACLLNDVPLITPADGTISTDCPTLIPIGGSAVCNVYWSPISTVVPDGGYVIEAYWDNLVPAG